MQVKAFFEAFPLLLIFSSSIDHIFTAHTWTLYSVYYTPKRLPFSIFLNVSWSNVNDASFRYLDMDSTSWGILPPRKLDSLVWCDDMVNRAAL